MYLDINEPHAVEMLRSIEAAVKKVSIKLKNPALLLSSLKTEGGLRVRTNAGDDEIKREVNQRVEDAALHVPFTELERITLVDDCVEAIKKCRNKAIILELEELG